MRTSHLLILLILLAACTPKQTTTYNTGSDGITLAFIQNTPSPEIYEDSSEPVFLQLWNKGAWNVPYDELVVTLNGDAFYLTVLQDPMLASLSEAAAERDGYDEPLFLDGKSMAYPQGERLDTQHTLTIKPILGAREQPDAELFATVCYQYRTELDTSVCVDANAYTNNQQRQVCSAQTLTFKDQGAPVAFVSVENRPSPISLPGADGRSYQISQPVFILTLRNVGTGTVLRPWTSSTEERAAACAFRAPEAVAGGVTVSATLSGVPLICTPNPVLLRDDEGFTTCHVPEESLRNFSFVPNYLALFHADLGYVYRESITTGFDILRLPEGTVSRGNPLPPDENPALLNGVERCGYCSTHREDPGCNDWPSSAETGVYSCSCGATQCRSRTCVFGSWCLGTNICCS